MSCGMPVNTDSSKCKMLSVSKDRRAISLLALLRYFYLSQLLTCWKDLNEIHVREIDAAYCCHVYAQASLSLMLMDAALGGSYAVSVSQRNERKRTRLAGSPGSREQVLGAKGQLLAFFWASFSHCDEGEGVSLWLWAAAGLHQRSQRRQTPLRTSSDPRFKKETG